MNNPYFDEMKFQLNPGSVEVVTESTKSFGGGLMGQLLNTGLNGFDPSYNPDYRKYRQMADELVAAMNAIILGAGAYEEPRQPENQPTAQSAAWDCPACGATNSGKFCEYCGTPHP